MQKSNDEMQPRIVDFLNFCQLMKGDQEGLLIFMNKTIKRNCGRRQHNSKDTKTHTEQIKQRNSGSLCQK